MSNSRTITAEEKQVVDMIQTALYQFYASPDNKAEFIASLNSAVSKLASPDAKPISASSAPVTLFGSKSPISTQLIECIVNDDMKSDAKLDYALTKALAADKNINVTDESGKTALMWAAKTNNKFATQWFLSHSADVNLQDSDGRTALMFALSLPGTEIDIAKQLLAKPDINPTLRDKSHKSAQSYAENMFAEYTSKFNDRKHNAELVKIIADISNFDLKRQRLNSQRNSWNPSY